MPITLNHSNIGVQYNTGSNYIIETVKSDLYLRNEIYDTIVRDNIQAAPVTPIVSIQDGSNIYAVESYTYTGSADTADYTRVFTKSTTCDILVVGGGGAGGKFGGGGGAGAILFKNSIILNGNINVKVGKGGIGTSSFVNGENGKNSSITINGTEYIAVGGGGGGGRIEGPPYEPRAGNNGGNGGGGSCGNTVSTVNIGGSSIKNTYSGWESYGNAGGSGSDGESGTPAFRSGGGGGAGSVGGDSILTAGGNGGSGMSFVSTFGTSVGHNGWFGGGGGGNTSFSAGNPGYANGGNGLLGGGGNGGFDGTPEIAAGEALPNTGGGGGGAKYNDGTTEDLDGGDGGSGIVIIRYLVGTIPSTNLLTSEPIVVSPVFTESIRTFIHSGGTESQTTHTITVGQNTICDILVIGGGGGGGNGDGSSNEPGGGGAGGIVYMVNKTLSSGTYKINVGKGGASNTNGNNSTITDNNNNTLTFDSISLIGKGGGKGATTASQTGSDGGSGGGGGHNMTNGGLATQGNTFWNGTSYVAGGFNGGKATTGGRGGGGGGAGELGDADGAGFGGDGVQVNITGVNTFYAGGGNAFPNRTTTRSDGGGGLVPVSGNPVSGGNALPDTGSGGSGAYGGSGSGGAGGSGIVIIKFKSTIAISEGNPVTHKRLNFTYNPSTITYDFTPHNDLTSWKNYATSIGATYYLNYFDIGGVYQYPEEGYIQLTLPNGYNQVKVNYNNPFSSGYVNIYIDNVVKQTCPANSSREYIQPYTTGQVLKIDEQGGIVGENLIITLTNTNFITNTYTLNFPVPTIADINNNSNIVLRGAYDISLSTSNALIIPKSGQYIHSPTLLIKDGEERIYPPVRNFTTDTTIVSGQPYGNGTYIVSASTFNSGEDAAFKIFNSTNSGWTQVSPKYDGSPAGTYTGLLSLGGFSGEWIKVQFPVSIKLTKYIIEASAIGGVNRAPSVYKIFGSNNNIDWEQVVYKSVPLVSADYISSKYEEKVSSNNYYRFFALVVGKNIGTDTWLGIGEWYIYGREFVSNSLSIRYNLLNPTLDPVGAQWTYNSSNTNVYHMGNVGIGTKSPEYNLDVRGAIYSSLGGYTQTGLTTWSIASDRRIKENIVKASYEKCLDNVKNIELYNFNFKDNCVNTNDKHQLGFIAQEVQQVYPKAVEVSKMILNTNETIDDLLSLNTTQIDYTLYGAVKNLIEKIEDIDNELGNIERNI